MALPETLNVGQAENDGTGDRRRDAFVKIKVCLEDLDVRVTNQVVEYPSRAAAQAATIPTSKLFVRTAGYANPGDKGNALYRRVSSQPTHLMRFTSADGAFWEFAETEVRLQQAGGVDDGVTPNDSALNAARSIGLVVRLPLVTTGKYLFSLAISFAAMKLTLDEGVTVDTPATDFSSNLRVRGFLRASLTVDGATAKYTYDFTADHLRPRREKIIWPTEGDIDRSRTTLITPSAEMRHYTVTGDAWTDASPSYNPATDIAWTLANDGAYRTSLLPVRGGQDVEWCRTQTDHVSGLMVRTTAGYYVVQAGAAGAASLVTQIIGAAATTAAIPAWPGRDTDAAYAPGNAMWGVRVLDNKRFCLLINGYRAAGPFTVQGEIIDVGPCFLGDRALTVTAGFLSRTYRSVEVGGRTASLLFIGDSTTATIHGGHPEIVAETLDGMRGIRITALNNYAVGGQSSADQYAVLQSRGIPAGTTHAVILIGRNDISGGAAANGFTQNYVAALIAMLQAAGVAVLLCVPFGAYTRASAGGSGVDVIRSENTARTLAMLKRLGALYGCKVLDLNGYSGPAIGSLAHHAYAESMWRDNLHESAFAYKTYGQAIANALAGMMLERMTAQVTLGSLPGTTGIAGVYGLRNGWIQQGDPLSYTAIPDGDQVYVTLNGQIAVGANGVRANPQTIYQLPPNLRVNVTQSAVYQRAFSDAANVDLRVGADGNILVFGLQSVGTYVRFDGISYMAQP